MNKIKIFVKNVYELDVAQRILKSKDITAHVDKIDGWFTTLNLIGFQDNVVDVAIQLMKSAKYLVLSWDTETNNWIYQPY